MATGFKLETPSNHIWRREFKVASGVILAGTEGNPDISLVPGIVDLDEGDWVTLDGDGKIIKVTTSTRLCWPVWIKGARRDVQASKSIVVVQGVHTAQTARFNNATVAGASVGDPLAAKSAQIDTAVSGDIVVGVLEKLPGTGTTSFPNGYIFYNTLNVGHVLP